MEKTRHFIVDTPVGQLAIYAKHDKTAVQQTIQAFSSTMYARMALQRSWLA